MLDPLEPVARVGGNRIDVVAGLAPQILKLNQPQSSEFLKIEIRLGSNFIGIVMQRLALFKSESYALCSPQLGK